MKKSGFVTTRECVERIKDVICHEVDGKVYDYHVADALGMKYDKLRTSISVNTLPLNEIAKFCYDKELVVNDILFIKNAPATSNMKMVN